MRETRLYLRVFALVVAACLLISGCSPRHTWSSSGGSDHGFKEGRRFDYSVESLICDGRVYFVLAADGFSGGSSNSDGGTSQGRLRTSEGRAVPWSCETKDGATGTVTIDGQPFDLAKGRVVLISGKANPATVEQIAVDMSKLQGVQGGNLLEKLDAVAATEPRIKEFLKECRGDK